MAEVQPPIAVETGGEHAQQLRAALAALGCHSLTPDAASGVCGAMWPDGTQGDLAVIAKGDGTMTVRVRAGDAFVKGTTTTEQGNYHVTNDGFVELTLDAGAVANRRDLIVARVYDDTVDSNGSTEWRLEIVKGATDGSVAEPALPESSIRLAAVRVNTGTTEITGPGTGAGQVQDRRHHWLEALPTNYYVCSLSLSGNIATGTPAKVVPVNSTFRDPSGMRSGNKMVAQAPGRYMVTAEIRGTSQLGNAFAYMDLQLRRNGNLIVSDSKYVAGIIPYTGHVAREIELDAGDEIDARIEHNSGGPEGVTGTFHASWVGPKVSGNLPAT